MHQGSWRAENNQLFWTSGENRKCSEPFFPSGRKESIPHIYVLEIYVSDKVLNTKKRVVGMSNIFLIMIQRDYGLFFVL